MKKNLLFAFACLLAFTGIAQERYVISGQKAKPPPLDIAKGCEDADYPGNCSKKKLDDIAFAALSATDIQNIFEQTKRDTIFLHTKLFFTVQKELDVEKSFIKVFEMGGKNSIDLDINILGTDFMFRPSTIYSNRATTFKSYLQLKVDREQQKLIPISKYKLKKTARKQRKETYAIYPGCETKKTLPEQQKCFGEKFNKHLFQHFNNQIPEKLELEGKVKMYVFFKISEDGTIKDLRSRTPHPQLDREIERVMGLLPKIKPATSDGKPISVRCTIPIIFTVI